MPQLSVRSFIYLVVVLPILKAKLELGIFPAQQNRILPPTAHFFLYPCPLQGRICEGSRARGSHGGTLWSPQRVPETFWILNPLGPRRKWNPLDQPEGSNTFGALCASEGIWHPLAFSLSWSIYAQPKLLRNSLFVHIFFLWSTKK